MTLGRDQGLWRISPNLSGLIEGDGIAMTNAPSSITGNGSLAYTGGDFIYVLCGSNSNILLRYSMSGNIWTTMSNAGMAIVGLGALVYTGGDFLYAATGNTLTGFLRYSISGNSWTAMTNAPVNISTGSLAFTGGDNIFLLNTWNSFLRYSIGGNVWTAMTGPGVDITGFGALVYTGGDFLYAATNNTPSGFLRYSIISNNWTTMAEIPLAFPNIISLAYTGGNFIYAVTNAILLRYSISGNNWVIIGTNFPRLTRSLTYTGINFLYGSQGNSTNGFWRIPLVVPVTPGVGNWQAWMR